MKVSRETLLEVFRAAIREQEKYEREVLKYTGDSSMLAGWREVLDKLENGNGSEDVWIVE